MKTLIQRLVETISPSGYEAAIREVIKAEIAAHVDDIQVDALGNLIAHKGTKSKDGKRIMLAAHMDEIGVMATHVDEKGFVRFTSIGGVYPVYCPGGRVMFTNGTVGTIGRERPEDPAKVQSLEHLFIDVGATSSKNCPVKIGDAAGFQRPFVDLGDRLMAKSMDDRVGVAVLIETLRQIKQTPNELVFVFSVQEEVGCRGATTAAYAIDPDIGISSDVTLTGDSPKSIKMDVSLGKGAAIKVRDGGMLSDPRLVNCMVNTAENTRIPYQLEVLEGGTTDARSMQISRAGMPAGCISIPCRYVHSPSEMVDYNDVLNTVKLFVALLSQPVCLE
ncbi:MAG TPA: M42 family metallopeptidase [Longilinea sp.]|nr:M42 family metallopeptidase [Longilinea sp.]